LKTEKRRENFDGIAVSRASSPTQILNEWLLVSQSHRVLLDQGMLSGSWHTSGLAQGHHVRVREIASNNWAAEHSKAK